MTPSLDIRSGQSIFDHVEISGCSQENRPSVNFASLSSKMSSMTNSAIHSGIRKARGGIFVDKSRGVTLNNNFVLDHKTYGIQLDGSQSLTVTNNVVANIARYPEKKFQSEPTGGLIMGSFSAQAVPLKNVVVMNNIVAGTEYTGYTALGHACGESESQKTFKNNVAHSIASSKGGQGAIIMIDKANRGSGRCLEGSYFAAYKCTFNGAASMEAAGKIVFSKMTMIDNKLGIAAMAQGGSYSEINDNKFYGDSEALDCPPRGGFCIKVSKAAIISGISAG